MEKLRLDTPEKIGYARLAYNRAVAAGDPDPVGFASQMAAESQFNPNATSRAGAIGLAQFMPATAERFGLDNPRDPLASMDAALKYRAYIRKFNAKRGVTGEQYVWSGYNAGEGRAVKAATGFKETRGYIKRINDYRPQMAEALNTPFHPVMAGGIAPDPQASPLVVAGSIGELRRPAPITTDATSLFKPVPTDDTVPALHNIVGGMINEYVQNSIESLFNVGGA